MSRVTAVVIDDEPIVRMDFAEMLRELDIDVLGTGTDGFDAIELCRRHHPHQKSFLIEGKSKNVLTVNV